MVPVKDNIELVFTQVTPKVKSTLKEFLKIEDSWLIETELMYLDEQK